MVIEQLSTESMYRPDSLWTTALTRKSLCILICKSEVNLYLEMLKTIGRIRGNSTLSSSLRGFENACQNARSFSGTSKCPQRASNVDLSLWTITQIWKSSCLLTDSLVGLSGQGESSRTNLLHSQRLTTINFHTLRRDSRVQPIHLLHSQRLTTENFHTLRRDSRFQQPDCSLSSSSLQEIITRCAATRVFSSQFASLSAAHYQLFARAAPQLAYLAASLLLSPAAHY